MTHDPMRDAYERAMTGLRMIAKHGDGRLTLDADAFAGRVAASAHQLASGPPHDKAMRAALQRIARDGWVSGADAQHIAREALAADPDDQHVRVPRDDLATVVSYGTYISAEAVPARDRLRAALEAAGGDDVCPHCNYGIADGFCHCHRKPTDNVRVPRWAAEVGARELEAITESDDQWEQGIAAARALRAALAANPTPHKPA